MNSKMGNQIFHFFRSELGWIGFAWQQDTLARLTFGHRTQESAQAKLRFAGTPAQRLAPEPRSLHDQLMKFACGQFVDFSNVDIDLTWCTEFQRAVIDSCRKIEWGGTATYGELAARAGSPRAARAVGSVMSSNRFPIVVPCHRVVSSTDQGGFTAVGGINMKMRMLSLEQQLIHG